MGKLNSISKLSKKLLDKYECDYTRDEYCFNKFLKYFPKILLEEEDMSIPIKVTMELLHTLKDSTYVYRFFGVLEQNENLCGNIFVIFMLLYNKYDLNHYKVRTWHRNFELLYAKMIDDDSDYMYINEDRGIIDINTSNILNDIFMRYTIRDSDGDIDKNSIVYDISADSYHFDTRSTEVIADLFRYYGMMTFYHRDNYVSKFYSKEYDKLHDEYKEDFDITELIQLNIYNELECIVADINEDVEFGVIDTNIMDNVIDDDIEKLIEMHKQEVQDYYEEVSTEYHFIEYQTAELLEDELENIITKNSHASIKKMDKEVSYYWDSEGDYYKTAEFIMTEYYFPTMNDRVCSFSKAMIIIDIINKLSIELSNTILDKYKFNLNLTRNLVIMANIISRYMGISHVNDFIPTIKVSRLDLPVIKNK